MAAAAIPAVLVEAALYLMPGFALFRERFARIPSKWTQGAWLWLAAMLPFLIYSIGTGCFTLKAFGLLAAIAAVLSFWYVVIDGADITLLAVVAAVMLSDAFKTIYPQLAPKATVNIIGQLMLIRTFAFALFCIRKHALVGFGFWPSRRDWIVGLRQFAYFIPVGFVLAYLTQFTAFRPLLWDKMIPAFLLTFLGMLWVVALSEELFFRGVLQTYLERITGNQWVGLVIASVLFGMVHLPFRAFPNWKFMIMAAAAGLFYGRAFEETGSIRSSMVTHALVASTWRVFLT